MKSLNPKNGKLIKEYTKLRESEISDRIKASYDAHHLWREQSLNTRTDLLLRAAKILREDKESLAKLITDEMGKPITESTSEIEKCAWACEHYAEKAEDYLSPVNISTDFKKSYFSYEPLGPVFAIMPWNFPFWQVFRFLAPNLAAGNTGLLKHAENVTGCSLAIEEIIKEAGAPEGVFSSLLIDREQTELVISDPRVKAVTLTGSTEAGKAVAALAGKYLKKSVLELGGSDPYIIFEDADLDLAAEKCFQSRMINGGQSCIAAKRFIVHDSVKSEFQEKLIALFKELQVGDPNSEETKIGPMARKDLRDKIATQVKESVNHGAKIIYQAELDDSEGYYYPPTLLDNVTPKMPAFEDEIFGPVASLISFRTESEAIRLANHSSYGLGSAIFSRNLEKAEHLARHEIQSGCCFVNDFVKSDPRLPFGGINESGYGRELSSVGIHEFLNIKTICL